ncbi:hypothetical protein KUCAC02_017976 [Chaenocephalus aceratus]|uniref:Uncharacterized protein n=1 Tax=Chaenocephalus aceratus TaxID=36190 RepID=A0ACB9W8M1_CHAAC|nr:hypothetical protein KUCAC02_017976 [Chaenocephalus aceratus]
MRRQQTRAISGFADSHRGSAGGGKKCHTTDMGERERGPDVGFIRLFLLGKNDGELGLLQQKMVEAESRRYHDIIQQDFLDSYKNLTYKTLMGMNWVAIHCPEAGYVMKTDSDMFVNTENLVYKLLRPEQQLRKNYFTGNNMRNFAPNRNKTASGTCPLSCTRATSIPPSALVLVISTNTTLAINISRAGRTRSNRLNRERPAQ